LDYWLIPYTKQTWPCNTVQTKSVASRPQFGLQFLRAKCAQNFQSQPSSWLFCK
jgi:hypothetical protein